MASTPSQLRITITSSTNGSVEAEQALAEELLKRRWVQLALAAVVLLVVIGGGIAAVQVQIQREQDRIATEREARATSLVDSLGSVGTPLVPRIIEDLADLRVLALPKLKVMLASAKQGSKEQLHASLALLPDDPGQAESLRQRLLTASPSEILVIRDSLTKQVAEVNPKLWAVAESPAIAMDQRLRALAALAGLDPQSDRWTPLIGPLAERLVAESPLLVGEWVKVFQPVRLQLLPPLAAIYHAPLSAGPELELNQTLVEYQRKTVAVNWLAEYAFDQPSQLADYLMDADADQWAFLWPSFSKVRDDAIPFLKGELAKTLPDDMPSSDPQREKLAKRQVNATVALLRLNQQEKLWPLLKHRRDPRARSYLIHRLNPLGADARAVVKRLDEETDVTIRRALLLSLGEFKETDFTPDERKTLLPKLKEMYLKENDPGLHAAAEWLLRTWKQEAWLKQMNESWAKDREGRDKRIEGIKELITKNKAKTPQWYVNTQGQTMVVIPGPVEFQMGSPKTEKERSEQEISHKRRIGRSFVLATKSVTLAEYRSLTKEPHENGEKYSHSPDLPAVYVNWYKAAIYCNLLSKAEGISEDQWCYDIKGKTPDDSGISLKENYLSLSGYRLPTEAEMEYATRAEAETSRFYGETEELLGKYAWYLKNSGERLQRVGLKKPNDFGLFDVQGNCFTWCQEVYYDYPKVENEKTVEDKEYSKLILTTISTTDRVMRGGSFIMRPSLVRSSSRNSYGAADGVSDIGFRPARTFTP